MPKRDSKLSLHDAPALRRYYIAAHARIFGKDLYVHPKHNGRFLVFEDELRELGFSAREYAYTIVTLLKKWAISKGFNKVPINAFTGDWALDKFKRVAGSKYVDISNVDTDYDLYWSELTVARSYIHENVHNGVAVKLRDVVDELKPLLSEHWLRRYYNGGQRPVNKVLDDLCEEYDITFARNYADIVSKLRGNISL